ncbi:28692_t:CDS:2, partial [Racocetra persica]
TVKQYRKRLARERQRNLKRRKKVTNTEPRVEVEITNTTLNNNSIRLVEVEVPTTTNKTNTQAIENEARYFFVDSSNSTGKIFLYNILLAYVRSLGEIAVAVASSRIATLLISGSCTAHSRFKILLKPNESLICNISHKKLSSDIVIPKGKLPDLINFVYPNLVEYSSNINYIVSRAILIPKNDDIENISSLIIDWFLGELHTYPSANDF